MMPSVINKVIFLGTASFAVPSLNALLKEGYDIVGVVTAPDRPAGRGRKVKYSPVKEFALEKNLNLLQPENLKESSFIQQLKSLNPDVMIVVAFRMLPELVWAIPPFGTFNLHASLLPQYRGAAPINHAIINGEQKTGVTTFFIDDKIDTGKIIASEKTHIEKNETAGELHDRLMEMGASLIIKTTKVIEDRSLGLIDQKEKFKNTKLKAAPKIFREDCKIDWSLPALKVYNFIRGLSPIPAAFTNIEFKDGRSKILKIFYGSLVQGKMEHHSPGNFYSDGKSYIDVICEDGKISMKKIQIEGKRPMEIEEFLKGFKMEDVRRFYY